MSYGLETSRFLEMNDAVVVHYGFSGAKFLNMSIADIRPEEDQPRAAPELAGSLGEPHEGPVNFSVR